MAKDEELKPPALVITSDDEVETESLANLLEWFLNYDQRTALVRHLHVEEIYQWLRSTKEGAEANPFETAEVRFAVGIFQTVRENYTEASLRHWISEALNALGAAKETTEDITRTYGLDISLSHVSESQKIPSEMERTIFLRSSWIEALCTAEVRFLGWVYQEIYKKPFEPIAD